MREAGYEVRHVKHSTFFSSFAGFSGLELLNRPDRKLLRFVWLGVVEAGSLVEGGASGAAAFDSGRGLRVVWLRLREVRVVVL